MLRSDVELADVRPLGNRAVQTYWRDKPLIAALQPVESVREVPESPPHCSWSLLASWRHFLEHACRVVSGQTENAPGAFPDSDGFDRTLALSSFRNNDLLVHPEVSPQRNMHDRSPFALNLDDLLR